jgi:hypothetical protein
MDPLSAHKDDMSSRRKPGDIWGGVRSFPLLVTQRGVHQQTIASSCDKTFPYIPGKLFLVLDGCSGIRLRWFDYPKL